MALITRGLVGWWCAVMIGATLFSGVTALAANSITPGDEAFNDKLSVPAEPFSHETHFGWLESEFMLAAGLRADSLDWSIAGFMSGGSPNVLSELSWSNVDSFQLSVTNRSHINKHIYIRGTGNYAWIMNGAVQDSDYGEDSRRAEWSRSISDSKDDELWDVSVGGGYSFYLMQDRLTVSPMAGYSYHKQNFRITNGSQLISQDNPFSGDPGENPPPAGPLSGQLNSTYRAQWAGPWIGFDIRYRPQDHFPKLPPMELGLVAEIHWADYYGEGNWNLRSDLAHPKSFEHKAKGHGISLSALCRIELAAQWDLALSLNIQDWSTSSGRDRKFLAEGGSVDTRLNEVSWETTSFMIGAVYRF